MGDCKDFVHIHPQSVELSLLSRKIKFKMDYFIRNKKLI